jgi:cytochrome P450
MLRTEDSETGRHMSPPDVVHNVQFFIVAGHRDTTALTLAWALLPLEGYPEVHKRARAEARPLHDAGNLDRHRR